MVVKRVYSGNKKHPSEKIEDDYWYESFNEIKIALVELGFVKLGFAINKGFIESIWRIDTYPEIVIHWFHGLRENEVCYD